MTAPTILVVVPTVFCFECGAPVNQGQLFCSGECEAREAERFRAPQDEGSACIVCGTRTDVGQFCDKGCYDLWTAPSDDDSRASDFHLRF